MLLSSDTNLYTLISLFMILLISLLFIFSLRTIYSQRKLDEMKTDFINNMTHEIKTPIATISLACEMLEDESVTSDSATRLNFINIISDENRRMRILIETLLQSAKMSRKNFALNPKEIDLNILVLASIQNFKLTLQNRHGTIETHLGDINGTLYADDLHISNMLHNLIDNAIKYSDREPHITITTRTEPGVAIFEITDNGIGIAKEDQKHIFEKFYRVSTGDVHNVKDLALGSTMFRRLSPSTRAKFHSPANPDKAPPSPSHCRWNNHFLWSRTSRTDCPNWGSSSQSIAKIWSSKCIV